MHSYERAAMPREKAIAYAYHLREQARGIPVRNRAGDKERRNAYGKVAKAFLTSAGETGATSREQSEYYRLAAEAFLTLEDHAQAAQAFEKASKFTNAAQNYHRAGMFNELVAVIKNHRAAMDSSVAEKLTNVARYYYLERGDFKYILLSYPFQLPLTSDHRKASSLFSNAEEQLEFVRDRGLDIAKINTPIEREQYTEAADLHVQENRMVDAVEVLKDRSLKERKVTLHRTSGTTMTQEQPTMTHHYLVFPPMFPFQLVPSRTFLH